MNITLTSNIDEFRARMKERAKQVRRVASKSPYQAARYMMYTAKSMAPRFSGETIDGIRMRSVGNKGWKVESIVEGKNGFKQNLFANQSAPFRTVNYKKHNKWYAVPQKVVYGTSAYSVSGNPIKWTDKTPQGHGRFFHWATVRTQKYFKNITRDNLKSALAVRFNG